jgi:hypothetical protein
LNYSPDEQRIKIILTKMDIKMFHLCFNPGYGKLSDTVLFFISKVNKFQITGDYYTEKRMEKLGLKPKTLKMCDFKNLGNISYAELNFNSGWLLAKCDNYLNQILTSSALKYINIRVLILQLKNFRKCL